MARWSETRDACGRGRHEARLLPGRPLGYGSKWPWPSPSWGVRRETRLHLARVSRSAVDAGVVRARVGKAPARARTGRLWSVGNAASAW